MYFIMMSQLKHLKQYEAQLLNYDVTTQKFANLLDVCSLACIIKVLNGRVVELKKCAIISLLQIFQV